MSANTFDVIQAKAKEIVAFHMVSHGMTPDFTDEEASAIELGMSSGIHAAIEHYEASAISSGGES